MGQIYDNKVKTGPANVPGKPTAYTSLTPQPADTGATATKVQEPPRTAETEGPDVAKNAVTGVPPTSPLKGESSHMPGSDSQPHV